MLTLLLQGFLTMAVLIVAIGAQNVFVLKQGLLKNHIFWVALTCCVCDIFLSAMGIFGLGKLINNLPWVQIALATIGSLFLIWYGYKAAISALTGNSCLQVTKEHQDTSLKKTIIATLAITLLNPHVYLDTVVILGGITAHLSLANRILFFIGAMFASFSWFFSLGYGARLLLPFFNRKQTWQILDTIIAIIMFLIAFSLLKSAYGIYTILPT